ncbi:hypothetical protein, partial [Escherichia coli]
RNRSHWSTSKTPSYTKSVSWQHHREGIPDSPGSSEVVSTHRKERSLNFHFTLFNNKQST